MYKSGLSLEQPPYATLRVKLKLFSSYQVNNKIRVNGPMTLGMTSSSLICCQRLALIKDSLNVQNECSSSNNSHHMNSEFHVTCPVTLEMGSGSLIYCPCLIFIARCVHIHFQSNWSGIFQRYRFLRYSPIMYPKIIKNPKIAEL